MGGLVSPSTVGLEVVGNFDGMDVGALDVGKEVGAFSSTKVPISNCADLIPCSEIKGNFRKRGFASSSCCLSDRYIVLQS